MIFNLLRTSNFNILQLFEFISLALNFFLCLDIVLTMRNPFYPHERRMKFYLPLSVIIGVIGFSLSLKRVSDPLDGDKRLSLYGRALFSVFFLTMYIIFAISSLAYVWRINTREGMSSEVRKDFVMRHLLYVCSYILTWLPYLGFAYYILYVSTVQGHSLSYREIASNDRFSDSFAWWFNAYNLSCIGTGILMSIVRAREPIFKMTIKTYIYQYFGELYQNDTGKSGGMDGTLLSFLMSSLNIELVHIILTTISKNTVGTPKSKDNFKVYQDYDHTNMNTFVLDSITIEDRKQWDINAVKDSAEEHAALRKHSSITKR